MKEFLTIITIVKRYEATDIDNAHEVASDIIGELPVDEGDVLNIEVIPCEKA